MVNYFIIIINIFMITVNTIITIKLCNLAKKMMLIKNDKKKISNDYLSSLEFNILLDKNITPLLGKMSNEEIVNVVYQCIIREDNKSSDIDKNTMCNYIKDVLSNYNNTYSKIIEDETVVEEPVLYTEEEPIKNPDMNKTDISNTLFNFYN